MRLVLNGCQSNALVGRSLVVQVSCQNLGALIQQAQSDRSAQIPSTTGYNTTFSFQLQIHVLPPALNVFIYFESYSGLRRYQKSRQSVVSNQQVFYRQSPFGRQKTLPEFARKRS